MRDRAIGGYRYSLLTVCLGVHVHGCGYSQLTAGGA